jgi:hypothetical protein
MNAHLIGYKRSVILVLFIAIGSTGLGRILLIDNRYGLRPNSFLPIKRKAQLHGSFCFNKKEKQKISTSSSITKLTIISKIWTAADSIVAAAAGNKMAAALSQLDDEIVRGMAIGAVFTDYVSSGGSPNPLIPWKVLASH